MNPPSSDSQGNRIDEQDGTPREAVGAPALPPPERANGPAGEEASGPGAVGSAVGLVRGRLGSRRWIAWVGCAVLGVAAVGAVFLRAQASSSEVKGRAMARPEATRAAELGDGLAMSRQQQEAVGVKVAAAEAGTSHEKARAPGRIAADQEHFAFINARAAGVVRSVVVNLGQEVRAGDVLATIDSPAVGAARLELRTQLQALEVARAESSWQAEILANIRELIAGLKRGDEPDAIQARLEGRPVGAGRDRLMTGYAQYRLASASMDRNTSLLASNAVSTSQFQQARAAYEAASGSYQALLDSTEYEARLAALRAEQAARQAETAVNVARERLKILGVGLEDAAIAGSPGFLGEGGAGVPGATLSTYTLVAPFDGTILDRELVVPGVSVDLTTRLFTIADLSTVWVEVNVSEGDFATLARAEGGEVRFESPAYPGRSFAGRVLYRGDLVDEASRTVKLLAAAENSERLLKPGMFVEATIQCPGGLEAAQVPDAAILAKEDGSHVFVRTSVERFERREVDPGERTDGRVSITRGLKPGEEVVVEGASKLESLVEGHEGGNG